MADDQDWRLRAKVDGGAGALDHLLASVRGEAGADVTITHDGGNLLFAYTASRDEIVSTKSALQAAARRGAIEASIDVSHWDGDVDEWVQVDPPLTGPAKSERDAAVRDAEQPESRTMVASAGRMVRAEVEQTMRDWADKLGLKCEVIEHPHLLTTQVAFTVTGPKRKVDEFAQGLRAEELATMRTERAVMMSPL
jgi:hypothetical protein